jgi:hypothetical protein
MKKIEQDPQLHRYVSLKLIRNHFIVFNYNNLLSHKYVHTMQRSNFYFICRNYCNQQLILHGGLLSL